ncbi:MAG TPA: cytochrome c [Steroidobacteraceae bacterium]|nr:cytochrome c [Steroidobacteraceae bacterium]
MSTTAGTALTIAALGFGGLLAASAQERVHAAPGPGPVKPGVTKSAYDIPDLIKQLQVPEDVFRGRVLWVQRCALCHDGVGQPSYHTMGPWLDADTIKSIGEPAVRAIIATGTASMPEFRYDLSARQVNDLLAFLKTVTWKPTPAELAVKGGFGHGGS